MMAAKHRFAGIATFFFFLASIAQPTLADDLLSDFRRVCPPALMAAEIQRPESNFELFKNVEYVFRNELVRDDSFYTPGHFACALGGDQRDWKQISEVEWVFFNDYVGKAMAACPPDRCLGLQVIDPDGDPITPFDAKWYFRGETKKFSYVIRRERYRPVIVARWLDSHVYKYPNAIVCELRFKKQSGIDLAQVKGHTDLFRPDWPEAVCLG